MGYYEIFNKHTGSYGLNAPFNLTTPQNTGTMAATNSHGPSVFNQNVLWLNIGLAQPGWLGGFFSAEDQKSSHSYIISTLGIPSGDWVPPFHWRCDYKETGHSWVLFVYSPATLIVNDPASRATSTPNVHTYPDPFFGSSGTGEEIVNSDIYGAVVRPGTQGATRHLF